METKKYKTDVKTLSKVFQSLEGMNFDDLPILDSESKFENQFITTLVLSLGENITKLNDMFISITGESKDFSEDGLEELCIIAQGFFDNTPSRFKDTIRIMIDGQRQQRNLAMLEMRKGMETLMTNMQKEATVGTPTLDAKSVLKEMGITPKD